MTYRKINRRARLGTAFAALAIAIGTVGAAEPAAAQPRTFRPSGQTLLSIGEGQVVKMSRNIADIWVSNPDVADVRVTSARALGLFGKKMGETTVIATAADGSVVYATNVRVSQNLTSVNDVIRAAMPESDIRVTTVGQVAVLNGTVASPEDAAQAQSIVLSYLNPGKKEGDALDIMPINRLRTATPLQVTLKVRIAEVSRSLLKQIGVNLLTSTQGDFSFGIAKGGGINLPPVNCTENCAPARVIRSPIGSTISGVGRLFGMDIMSSLDLAETDGVVTILAEPTLTALSGETASFLAGGEFPIPISQSFGSISIEYKQYGVGLAFTPIVLADGRISMRVRPEVSELSDAGSVRLNDFVIPALTTRRAETTVELGSGQSFMIAGLLKNTNNNNIDKAPVLGDLPILGALFRSTRFQRQETELVIVVTPYLVRPVSTQLATPIDGYRAPSDAEQFLEGQSFRGVSGSRSPTAIPAGGAVAAPSIAAPMTGAVAAPGFKL
ncbi:MAG: type II and III secretion system protein family protein [Microvirga sp.]